MTGLSDSEKLGDDACATLRQGLGRGRQLTADARKRLSELTSDTVYPGLADVILANSNAAPNDPGAEDAPLQAPTPTAT